MHQGGIDSEGSRREFLEILAEFDTPAYIQRGVRTEAALQRFLTDCRREREDRLEFSRLRLAQLAALINEEWSVIDPYAEFADQNEIIGSVSEYLSDLHRQWSPELRVPLSPTLATQKTRRALGDLSKSFQAFNGKWKRFLHELDFTEINQVRADYNNYYVCEKAAALQSERIASHGFQELPPLTTADVVAEFPLLRVPRVC